MKAIIKKQLLVYLVIGFVLMTIIGTLTHELGHYLVVKILGHEAKIHYASISWTVVTFSESFWVRLGGPLQTMLTGTIGITLIFLFNKSFQKACRLSFGQWVLVFISLFWLRQTFNFLVWIGGYIFNGQFSGSSDEIRLANYLQIPNWTISFFTATIGAIILTIIIFNFIPRQQRLTFIISGLVGGVTGYILWLHLLGPVILPRN